MSHLRVVHVLASDAFAGLERHALRLASELRRRGCLAELACPPSAQRMREEAAAERIPVHPASAGARRAWLVAAMRHLAADPPHAIHVHDGRSAIAVAAVARSAGLVVRTQHFAIPASVQRRGWLGAASVSLHRALNRRLDGYIAVSEAVARSARERRETGSAEVTVIPPGIELPGDGAVAKAQALRDRSADPVVAYIGRLEREKRLEVLIQAMPRIRERLPSCRFVIAGSGAAEPELRRLARERDVDDAIAWKGWVPEPHGILETAHVYVNTWPWEGFGMAMAEAMAAGLPVVAVDSAASPEIVEDGVNGLLVPSGDANALADAVSSLAGDRGRARSMGEAARERAVQRWGLDRTASATLAFYRRLLQKTRS